MTEIVCKDCGKKKKLYAKGLCSVCYQRKRSQLPEAKESIRKWREDNKEHIKEYNRTYYEKYRDYYLLRNYGINQTDFDTILESQGNCCPICMRPPEESGRLEVDHCHETGRIRGIICSRCNTMLGMALDSPQMLIRGANYLLEDLDD